MEDDINTQEPQDETNDENLFPPRVMNMKTYISLLKDETSSIDCCKKVFVDFMEYKYSNTVIYPHCEVSPIHNFRKVDLNDLGQFHVTSLDAEDVKRFLKAVYDKPCNKNICPFKKDSNYHFILYKRQWKKMIEAKHSFYYIIRDIMERAIKDQKITFANDRLKKTFLNQFNNKTCMLYFVQELKSIIDDEPTLFMHLAKEKEDFESKQFEAIEVLNEKG